ncbi:MAG: PepSY domain-containing protein [Leptolyngbyaceae bacterium]|nr:PepSY domain-containing protein [Leptolyngbyaceae bacterium]
MNINLARLRQLHRMLVPFMVVPLLLTLTTGLVFQFALMGDRAGDFLWLLDWHRGKFGPVNLSAVYPLLNALGLLTLVITGFLMWWRSPTRKRKKAT